MTGAKSLSAFSHDWVGGDIRGLQSLDEQCRQVASRINDADQALAHQVSSVVGGGGWTGKAADAFTSAWDKDSKAGAQLADAWVKIGEIAINLAGSLAALESALEETASQLEKQGIPVDPATGLPRPDTTMSGNASPSPQTLGARNKLASEYTDYRAEILKQANAARAHATYELYTVTSNVLPPGTDWGQLTNNLDGLRQLWATPTQYRAKLEDRAGKANDLKADVTDEQWRTTIAGRRAAGNNFRMDHDLIEKGIKVRQDAARLEGKLANSPPESKLSMAANGDADGLGLIGAGAKAVRMVPIVGTVVGGVIQYSQDRAAHESQAHSIIDGVASNGAAYGAAALAAGAIGTGSVVAVGAGAIVGTAAAVGVGDFVHHAIQENWSADIQKHGVLGGVGHGIADSFDQTRHDVAHWFDDLNPF